MASTTIDFFPTDYSNTLESQNTGEPTTFTPQPMIGGRIPTGYDSNPNSFEDEPPLWEGISLCT